MDLLRFRERMLVDADLVFHACDARLGRPHAREGLIGLVSQDTDVTSSICAAYREVGVARGVGLERVAANIRDLNVELGTDSTQFGVDRFGVRFVRALVGQVLRFDRPLRVQGIGGDREHLREVRGRGCLRSIHERNETIGDTERIRALYERREPLVERSQHAAEACGDR